MGHSAGGGLAAATALLARDRGRRRPAGPISGLPHARSPHRHAGRRRGQPVHRPVHVDAGGQPLRLGRAAWRPDIAPEQLAGSARPSPPPWRDCPRPSSPWAPSICFLRRTPPSPCVWRRRACPSSCMSTRAGVHGFDAAPGRLAEQFAPTLGARLIAGCAAAEVRPCVSVRTLQRSTANAKRECERHLSGAVRESAVGASKLM